MNFLTKRNRGLVLISRNEDKNGTLTALVNCGHHMGPLPTFTDRVGIEIF